jgi:hypothetical protein
MKGSAVILLDAALLSILAMPIAVTYAAPMQKVTGGGIAVKSFPPYTFTAIFGFNVIQDKTGALKGHLDFSYVNLHEETEFTNTYDSTSITSLSVTGNTATFTGTAKFYSNNPGVEEFNGQIFKFEVTVTDGGEPGTQDTFFAAIYLLPAEILFEQFGTTSLTGGNIQVSI